MVKIRVYDTDGVFRGGLFKLHMYTRLNTRMWEAPPHADYDEVLMDVGDSQWYLVRIAKKPELSGPEEDAFDAASKAIRYSEAEAQQWFVHNGYEPPEYLRTAVADKAPHRRIRRPRALPPLPEKIKAIHELLCSLPDDKALNSPEIVAELLKRKVIISESNVRKLISKHRKSLRIRRCAAGYYVKPENRP